MATRESTRQARENLDARLGPLGPASHYAPPRLGWIRAVRDALRMPAAELARRIGISGPSVRSLEEKELTGGIRLDSLRRAAAAMDCTLVYAFIPNSSLEDTALTQARSVLARRMARVGATMSLEAQGGSILPSELEREVRRIADSADLWAREPAGE